MYPKSPMYYVVSQREVNNRKKHSDREPDYKGVHRKSFVYFRLLRMMCTRKCTKGFLCRRLQFIEVIPMYQLIFSQSSYRGQHRKSLWKEETKKTGRSRYLRQGHRLDWVLKDEENQFVCYDE